MKKTFLLSVLFLTAFAMVTSCVNDDDSHAAATVAFQGVMTDLFYSVESEEQNGDSEGEIESDSQQAEIDENVYDYSQAIKDAFDELGLTGVKSQIEEKAKVSEGSISYAEYVCAMQAAAKIQKKMDFF